jgi:hypothetical protein
MRNMLYSQVQLQSEHRRPTICPLTHTRSLHSSLGVSELTGVIALVSTWVIYPLNLDARANDPRVRVHLSWIFPICFLAYNLITF